MRMSRQCTRNGTFSGNDGGGTDIVLLHEDQGIDDGREEVDGEVQIGQRHITQLCGALMQRGGAGGALPWRETCGMAVAWNWKRALYLPLRSLHRSASDSCPQEAWAL